MNKDEIRITYDIIQQLLDIVADSTRPMYPYFKAVHEANDFILVLEKEMTLEEYSLKHAHK